MEIRLTKPQTRVTQGQIVPVPIPDKAEASATAEQDNGEKSDAEPPLPVNETVDTPENSQRDNLATDVSSDSADSIAPPAKKRKKTKKRKSTMEIARQNQIAYNKFITKQVPKLMKVFGIETESETESD